MHKLLPLLIIFIFGGFVIFKLHPSIIGAINGTTYYVSPTGNDTNSGTDSAHPFQTIAKINSMNFHAGDQILLEGGQIFSGNLYFDSNDVATPESPIVISSYGAGRASINSGDQYGLYVYNAAGFKITDLNFMGSGNFVNNNNGISFYTDLPGNIKLPYIYINNVQVSGYGGDGIKIGGWNGMTGYRDIQILNVVAHDNREAGITTFGEQMYSNQNVYVGYSSAYNNKGNPQKTTNSGSGIALGSVQGGKIERSTAYENGSLCVANECGVGIWTYDSDQIVISHNESYNNRTGSNADGDGFDFDQNVSNSVIEYNYSHGNDGAGYLIAHGPNNSLHTGNTIRYNISENDIRKLNSVGAIQIWGRTLNANIYNNTVYLIPSQTGSGSALNVANWAIESQDVNNLFVRNNIFYTTGAVKLVNVSAQQIDSQNTIRFQGNNYYSASSFSLLWGATTYNSLSSWRNATQQEILNGSNVGYSVNPQLSGVGLGGTVANPINLELMTSYRLLNTSPMQNSGLSLPTLFGLNVGPNDFFGNVIPVQDTYDIGAQESTYVASTPTPSPTLIPTQTPSPTPIPTATPVPTVSPSPTQIPTATPTSSTKSLIIKVANGADDVNEDGSTYSQSGANIWVGNAASANGSYTGLRFSGVTLPKSATILSAKLKVTSAQSQWIGIKFILRAQALGNSPAFASASKPSQRTLTVASVNHNTSTSWSKDVVYELSDITAVLQELVNRSDWQSGNAISLILKGNGNSYGRKYIYSYEAGSAKAPTIEITYR